MFKKQHWESAQPNVKHRPDAQSQRLERKVGLSRLALYFERVWPRFWVAIVVAAAFVLVSMTGFWSTVSEPVHLASLAGFALAALASIIFAFRVPFPTRDESVRRLERDSGVLHRPASTYEDTVTGADDGSTTAAIWKVHQERLKARLDGLEVGVPRPDTAKRDPVALRAIVMIAVVAGLLLAGDSAYDRLQSAFRFGSQLPAAGARLDAWVTPPHYTARAPILLADGSRKPESGAGDAVATPAAIDVPDKSQVIVRIGGAEQAEFKLLFENAIGEVVATAEAKKPPAPEGEAQAGEAKSTIIEVKGALNTQISTVRLKSGEHEMASWQFNVIADKAPVIAMTKEMEKTRRGAMKLYYRLEDDYGVASAEAVFERMPLEPGDPKTSWAREEILKGPRLPLERPPKIVLRIPSKRAKKPETWSFHELGSHPWAGLPVRMTLVAKDHGGNVGKSETKEIVLPERLFLNPFAKAVLEQRRRLVFDARYRPKVIKALKALTIAPERHIRDKAVYLGLRSVYYRLNQGMTRRNVSSAIEQLWHIALRIENGGGLSAAEQRLRELQEQLAKALERGASNEEISKLMQQLRQALNEFLRELSKQAQNMPPQQRPNNPNQFMRPQDLQQMLNQLEQMAKQGSRQMAQEMLSQLRDLIDRLQSGRMVRRPGQQNGRGQQMMQMMNRFGDLIGKQQRLMDDTHGARRGEGRRGQQGQQGQGQQQGQQQQGQSGRGGRQGQGQQGQSRQGQGRQGQGQGRYSPDALGNRQGQLSNRLSELQQGLQRFGMRGPSQLDGARRSMENARRALERGDLGEATREQSRALEQLRQGAQQMAEQMMRQMPSRFGRANDAPLDPLGRPQRTDGPDLGTSVKLPDEIDAQRVREILNELRRRLGERFRPEMELEYLERLLRRF